MITVPYNHRLGPAPTPDNDLTTLCFTNQIDVKGDFTPAVRGYLLQGITTIQGRYPRDPNLGKWTTTVNKKGDWTVMPIYGPLQPEGN